MRNPTRKIPKNPARNRRNTTAAHTEPPKRMVLELKIIETSRFPVRDLLQEYLDMAQQASPSVTVPPRIRRINPTPMSNAREPIYQTTVVDIPQIHTVLDEFKAIEEDVAQLDVSCKKEEPQKTACLREKIEQRLEVACVKAREHMMYTEQWSWDSKTIPLQLELLTIDTIKMLVAEAGRLKATEAAQAWRELLGANATIDTLMLHHLKSVSTDEAGNWQWTYQHQESDTDQWEFLSLFHIYPQSESLPLAFFMLSFIASAWLQFKQLSTDTSPHAPDMNVLIQIINRINSLREEMLMLAYEPKITTGGKQRETNSKNGQNRKLDHAAIRQAVMMDVVRRRNGAPPTKDGKLTAARKAVAKKYNCGLRVVETASNGIK